VKSKYCNECIGNTTGEAKDSLVELAYQRIPKNVRQVIEGKHKELLSEQEACSLNLSDPMAFENWVDKMMYEIETNDSIMTKNAMPDSFTEVVRDFILTPWDEVKTIPYTETAAYSEALERDKAYVRNKLAESLKVSPSETTEYMVEQVVLNGARSYDYLKTASNREP